MFPKTRSSFGVLTQTLLNWPQRVPYSGPLHWWRNLIESRLYFLQLIRPPAWTRRKTCRRLAERSPSASPEQKTCFLSSLGLLSSRGFHDCRLSSCAVRARPATWRSLHRRRSAARYPRASSFRLSAASRLERAGECLLATPPDTVTGSPGGAY